MRVGSRKSIKLSITWHHRCAVRFEQGSPRKCVTLRHRPCGGAAAETWHEFALPVHVWWLAARRHRTGRLWGLWANENARDDAAALPGWQPQGTLQGSSQISLSLLPAASPAKHLTAEWPIVVESSAGLRPPVGREGLVGLSFDLERVSLLPGSDMQVSSLHLANWPPCVSVPVGIPGAASVHRLASGCGNVSSI